MGIIHHDLKLGEGDFIMENDVIDETTDSTVDTQDKTKEEKKFSQKELDSLIQTRIKREKDNFTSQSKSWETEKASYDEKLTAYENSLKTLLDAKKIGLDEDIKTLLDELDVTKQIEYLAKLDAKKEKIKDTPIMPHGNSDSSNNNSKTKKLNNFLGG
jgi:hypothetical protein